jgi:hypothetical protein
VCREVEAKVRELGYNSRQYMDMKVSFRLQPLYLRGKGTHTYWKRGWVDLRTVLDIENEEQIPASSWNRTDDAFIFTAILTFYGLQGICTCFGLIKRRVMSVYLIVLVCRNQPLVSRKDMAGFCGTGKNAIRESLVVRE